MFDVKVTLLIVDNDPSIRFSLCQIFRCMGHTVRSAEDGIEALHEIGEQPPDILLSDLQMPRMSGYQLLSVVRRRFPSVYVIAMTGLNRSGKILEEIPADGFYQKASGVVALLQAVQNGISSDRLAVWASRKSQPSREPEDSLDGRKAASVYVGCPECLRAFPHTAGDPRAREGTSCAHCGAQIDYAVVEQFA